MNVFIILFCIPLIWTYILYPIFLSRVPKRSWIKDENYQPSVSIIVPVYNGEEFVEAKIDNIINQNYPKSKIEIIFVESGSTDKTGQKIKDSIVKFQGIVNCIFEKEKRGKNSATNAGLSYAQNNIIILTDVDSYFETKDSLKKILRNFADPIVGGVAPAYFGKYEGSSRIAKEEEKYWIVEDRLWDMESKYDSVSTMLGECLAFRRGLIMEIPLSSTADDLHCTIQIKKMGYRVVYEPEAIIRESIPINFKKWFIQKKRRTSNTIMTLKNNLDIFFRYHPYGTIILPTHKVLTLFTPIFLLGFGISLLYSLNSFLLLLLPLIIILGILITSLKYGISSIICRFAYMISLLSLVLIALITFPFSNKTSWEKK